MSHDQESMCGGLREHPSEGGEPGARDGSSEGNLAALGIDSVLAAYMLAQRDQGTGASPTSISAPTAPQPESWAEIPQELRERAQWCVAKIDKAPRIATEGLPHARVNDPTTWRTFDQACAIASRFGLHIGYVLNESDEYACIDMDVKDDTTPQQFERIQKIVKEFDSYTERSLSGRGLHVWVRGKIAKGMRRDGVEVYSHERFMVCTGNKLDEKAIAYRQELLRKLSDEMNPAALAQPLANAPVIEGDEAVLRRATSAANGAKFQALYRGDWEAIGHKDHSRADMSLIQILAGYSRNNEQVKRLFLLSALGQRKKATDRRDYFDRTLNHVRSIQANGPNAEHGEQIAESILAHWQAKTDTEVAQGFALPTPNLRQEAYYGILREIADAGSAYTEAVPAALAINVLGRFCATIGTTPLLAIGDDYRSLRPFVLIVGPTSKGRKGTSAQLPTRIFEQIEHLLGVDLAYETSVSSGEGLVWMVRDPTISSTGEIIDTGINDKRVLLEVSEFSGVLAQAKREASVLTSVLRDAWDGRRLSTPNKNSPCRATHAHYVVLGHITREELTKLLTNTDIKNGFANRFMMVYSARQRIVDDPQPTPEPEVQLFAQRIAAAVSAAWNRSSNQIQLSETAKTRWIKIRRELENRARTADMESLMARSDTYVRILAAAIALINQEQMIEPKHLDAALAWVDHWEETANFCFTAAAQYDEMMLTKTVADELVAAVRKHGGDRVSRSIIYDELTNRGKRKDRNRAIFERAITALQNEAPLRITIIKVIGKGRPTNLFSLTRHESIS